MPVSRDTEEGAEVESCISLAGYCDYRQGIAEKWSDYIIGLTGSDKSGKCQVLYF